MKSEVCKVPILNKLIVLCWLSHGSLSYASEIIQISVFIPLPLSSLWKDCFFHHKFLFVCLFFPPLSTTVSDRKSSFSLISGCSWFYITQVTKLKEETVGHRHHARTCTFRTSSIAAEAKWQGLMREQGTEGIKEWQRTESSKGGGEGEANERLCITSMLLTLHDWSCDQNQLSSRQWRTMHVFVHVCEWDRRGKEGAVRGLAIITTQKRNSVGVLSHCQLGKLDEWRICGTVEYELLDTH